MSERYTKKDVRNVWENRFLPAAVSMGFDVTAWGLQAGGTGCAYIFHTPLPMTHYSTVDSSYAMGHIGRTAREAYHTLVNMACAWEAVARVQSEARRANLRPDGFMRERMRNERPEGHDSQCGECGRTWNSTVTPTPSARCPFEYEHDTTEFWESERKAMNGES